MSDPVPPLRAAFCANGGAVDHRAKIILSSYVFVQLHFRPCNIDLVWSLRSLADGHFLIILSDTETKTEP